MARMQCVTVLGAWVLSFTNDAHVMPGMASWTIRRETRAGGHRPFLFCCYKSNKQRKRLGGGGHPKKRKTCPFYTRNREKRKTCPFYTRNREKRKTRPFSLLKTCPFFSCPATVDCGGRCSVRTIGKRKTCLFSLLKTCPFFSSPATADCGGRCAVQTDSMSSKHNHTTHMKKLAPAFHRATPKHVGVGY
jgi:hypothetical protein